MISVGLILQEKFPVRLCAVLKEACRNLKFTLWRIFQQLIDGSLGAAEIFFERRPIVGKRAKYESPIDADAGHTAQGELALVRSVVSVGISEANQFSGIGEGPGMVRASEAGAVTLLVSTKLIAAMRTFVLQQADLTVAVVHHQDRRRANGLGHIVVLVGHLTGVADINPAAVPDPFELLLEDEVIVIHRTVNPRALNEGAVVAAL